MQTLSCGSRRANLRSSIYADTSTPRARAPPRCAPPAALPDLSPATVAVLLAVALPASVLLDEALDSAAPRVNSIANTETNGVRMFVARPAETTTTSNGHVVGGDSAGAAVVRRPAVILIHQILGLQQREAELAAALAAQEGVVAVAPDTFCGQSTLWPFRAITLGFKYALRGGASWGVESVHEVVTWLKSQPDVDPDRIVVAGWCYGGGSAVRYAAAYPGEVAGVTIFYGRPLSEASEVAKLGRTPVLGLYGTRDQQFPSAMLDKFKADLTAAGVPHRLEMFEGEGHAFIKDAQAVTQGGAAGRAWALFRGFVREVTAGAP